MESKLPSYSRTMHKGKPIDIESSAPQENISNIRDIMWGSHKNSSFSKKLLKHGMFYEKTMEAAERLKHSEETELRKRKEAISNACATFDDYVSSIRKIQKELAAKQKEMAFVAVQKYSALCIQTCFRGYSARKFVRRKFYGRLLCTFARFKRRFGRRVRSARIIQRCYRKYRSCLYSRYILMMVTDTKKLQRQYKQMMEMKKALIKEETRGTCMAVVQLALLHGSTRAIKEVKLKQLTPEAFSIHHNLALNSLVRIYKRNRRFRLLRNTYGKIMYAALSYHCHEESSRQEMDDEANPPGISIYQYIRLKVEAAIKKTPIKRTISKGVGSKSAVKAPKVDTKPLITSASHSTKLPVVEGDTSYIMHVAFPNESSGFYPLCGISDAMSLIEDMIVVAKENNNLVDGRVPVPVYNSAMNNHVVKSVSGSYGDGQASPGPCMTRKPLTAKELWPNYVRPIDPRIVEEEEAAIAAMAAAIEAEEKKKKGKRGRGVASSASVASATPVSGSVAVQKQKPIKPGDASLQPTPPSNAVPSSVKNGGVGAVRKAIQK